MNGDDHLAYEAYMNKHISIKASCIAIVQLYQMPWKKYLSGKNPELYLKIQLIVKPFQKIILSNLQFFKLSVILSTILFL